MVTLDLDFSAKGAKFCALCKRQRGFHKAVTLHCPTGMKTRIGYTSFHPTQTYKPMEPKP